MPDFEVVAPYQPAGDQPEAMDDIISYFKAHEKGRLTLRGVTGSGKTFTMAHTIAGIQKPTLVLSHNKTLAAQLYRELKNFLPHNAVEYFVSYYDYYQPEAYVPSRDLFIEKDAAINEEIDRLAMRSLTSLLTRQDTVIVASVSCIFGLVDPQAHKDLSLTLEAGKIGSLRDIASMLTKMQYVRSQDLLERGKFRLKGETLEIFPPYYDHKAIRIRTEWDEVAGMDLIETRSFTTLEHLDSVTIFAAKMFVMPKEKLDMAIPRIEKELKERYQYFMDEGKLVEAQRIKTRTEYDLDMIKEVGYCSGIEHYSGPLAGRPRGSRPYVLLDYFPKDFLMLIDESHQALPQLSAMSNGDHNRKKNLIDFGFRLPSAFDNRPLNYHEFDDMLARVLYISATPAEKEILVSDHVVEQLIRPTGLLDPPITVRPTTGQMEDIYSEIQKNAAQNERVLITTLTKKMAEDLAGYLQKMKVKASYIHSDLGSFERVEVLKKLRQGIFDVLIGINLLREGLDLPEVSLVIILDADKIGFLRSTTSLIQIIGRAARNAHGRVILYADRMSPAMEEAIAETDRRRTIQKAFNEKHHITPTTIHKTVEDILGRREASSDQGDMEEASIAEMESHVNLLDPKQKKKLIAALEKEMLTQAKELNFEKAAAIRDEITNLRS